jgi:hypothetical protein
MLLNAMHEYACLILAVDAFPDEVKQTRWAKATWEAACDEVGEHYECSTRMIRLVLRLMHVLLFCADCWFGIDHRPSKLGTWLPEGCSSQQLQDLQVQGRVECHR